MCTYRLKKSLYLKPEVCQLHFKCSSFKVSLSMTQAVFHEINCLLLHYEGLIWYTKPHFDMKRTILDCRRWWQFNVSFFIVTAQLASFTGRVVGGQSDSAFASEGGQQRDTVDQLELQFYEIQLEVYDAKFEILKHEEQLLVAQIDTLRRQIKGRLDPVSRAIEGGQVLNIL